MAASRLLLLTLAVLGSIHAEAGTTYHVDSASGNDASPGTASTSAWKTMTKLNAAQALLRPGDSVLFRRGQVFQGALRLETSGTLELPITYGSYGDGAKPVITGFATISGWKQVGDGIWEASCPDCSTPVNVVTINGKVHAMGRFPNADAPHGGYLSVDSHVGKVSITDAELKAEPNWTGAELVIRKYRWIIDRNKITKHEGSTLTYTSATVYEGVDRHGYFIQDDPRTLDAFGEWYFNPGAKTLRVFFGKTDPTTALVNVGVIPKLFDASNRQDIVIAGLAFSGANHTALTLDGSSRVTLRDCEIRQSGYNAIYGASVSKLLIEDCSIDATNNNAIVCGNTSNSIIRRVNISNTAMTPGMGASGDGTYNAITLQGNDNLLEDFSITNTGYIPVHFHGSRVTIRNGYIDGYASIKDDSGGIYTWTGATDKTPFTERRIVGNIILNSRGARDGAEKGEAKGFGIYLDDACANVEIIGNTVAHTTAGIFLHNAHHTKITGNTLFDNDTQLLMAHDDIVPSAQAAIREVLCNDNTLVSRTALQPVVSARSVTDDFHQFGNFDRNRFARPVDQNLIIDQGVKDMIPRAFDLADWQAVTKLSSTTQSSVVKFPAYTIEKLGPNLMPNSDFAKNVNETSCWSPVHNSAVTWVDGKLDGGTLQHAYKTPSGKKNATLVLINAGPLTGGRHYILRFTGLGAIPHASAAVRLRQLIAPYAGLTDYQYVKMDTTRRQCEMLFTAPSTQSGCSVVWSFNEPEGTVWLDNVTLQEAEVTMSDPSLFRLEYNRTDKPRTVTLDGEWVDVTGKVYTKTISLEPRASIVLIKKSAVNAR